MSCISKKTSRRNGVKKKAVVSPLENTKRTHKDNGGTKSNKNEVKKEEEVKNMNGETNTKANNNELEVDGKKEKKQQDKFQLPQFNYWICEHCFAWNANDEKDCTYCENPVCSFIYHLLFIIYHR
jgi:hypothetical protein